MLAPRFTLRAGLIGLTAGALVAVVVREAVQSEPWAIGVSVALLAVVMSLSLQAVVFGLSLALSSSQAGAARPVGAKKARVRLAGVESSGGWDPIDAGPGDRAAEGVAGADGGAAPRRDVASKRDEAIISRSDENHVEGGKG